MKGRRGGRSTRMALQWGVLSFLAVLAAGLLAGCSKANETLLYGTFTNSQTIPEKIVRAPGFFKQYSSLSDSDPVEEATEQIVKAWTDSEGTWFQTYRTDTTENDYNGAKIQTLARINKGNTVLEQIETFVSEFSPNNFPKKIDKTRGESYRIYKKVGD